MEKTLKIKTLDEHLIYGVLKQTNKKSKKLVIFVPGLTGYQDDHQFFNGAKFFAKKNIDTFRMNLYWGEKKGRKLHECGISTHAEDVATVLKYFRKKYKKMYLVGHSLGCPSILLVSDLKNKGVAGVILWDPSDGSSKWVKSLKYSDELKGYIMGWSYLFVIGKKMYDEWVKFDLKKMYEDVNVPLKLIVAGAGILKESSKRVMDYISAEKKLAVIPGATHTFREEGCEEKLFQETLEWLKKF